MKNLFSPLVKAIAVAACALSLGSCSRAEYAMLPQGASYSGYATTTTPAVASVATETVEATAPVTVAKDATPVEMAPATVSAPATPVAKSAASGVARSAAEAVASTAPAKLTLVQGLLASKIVKKATKMVDKQQLQQRTNTAGVAKSGVSGNVKLGIILMVVGAIIALLPGLFRLLGLIIFIVGVLFLLLALLDMV